MTNPKNYKKQNEQLKKQIEIIQQQIKEEQDKKKD